MEPDEAAVRERLGRFYAERRARLEAWGADPLSHNSGFDDFHPWHVAINEYALNLPRDDHGDGGFPHWMYEAKDAAGEVYRIAYQFGRERAGMLPATMRQCLRSPSQPVPENHLTCCKGVRCAGCPYLLALESADMPDAAKDLAKAWTCVAHILSTGGDTAKEGYVLAVDDRMFWDNVYKSLSDTFVPAPEAQPAEIDPATEWAEDMGAPSEGTESEVDDAG